MYAVLLKALVMSFVSEFILYMYLFERMFVFLLCIHSFEYVELSCMFAGNCQYLWLRVWMGVWNPLISKNLAHYSLSLKCVLIL